MKPFSLFRSYQRDNEIPDTPIPYHPTPSTGGILYTAAGALYFRSCEGTVTKIDPEIALTSLFVRDGALWRRYDDHSEMIIAPK